MARRPFEQGHLDSLCGVYSIINATVAAAAPIKRLGKKDCLELFGFLICALKLDDELSGAVISGCHYPVLSKLLKVADCWLRDRHGLALQCRRPFNTKRSRRTSEAIAAIAANLAADRRVAIIRLTGADNHWTVVTSVEAGKGRLHLADSGGDRFITRQTLLTRRRKGCTRLVVRDTVLVSVIEASPDALSFRLPAARERSRGRLVRPGRPKKFTNVDVEGQRQPLQHRDRRVFELPLKPADIGPVDPGIDGQVFLGNVPANPNLSKVPRNQGLRFHRHRPSP